MATVKNYRSMSSRVAIFTLSTLTYRYAHIRSHNVGVRHTKKQHKCDIVAGSKALLCKLKWKLRFNSLIIQSEETWYCRVESRSSSGIQARVSVIKIQGPFDNKMCSGLIKHELPSRTTPSITFIEFFFAQSKLRVAYQQFECQSKIYNFSIRFLLFWRDRREAGFGRTTTTTWAEQNVRIFSRSRASRQSARPTKFSCADI